ncbi:MAG: sulfatase-like hydrolase/transferase [Planctomycetes bacterium]|nr:sulfatase-like hydrolase/transferase [Planctomycetota bacterium]
MSRPRPAARAILALALAALPLVPAGCGGDRPAAPATATRGRYDGSGRLVEGVRQTTTLPNVVLVVLDTVRRDAIEPTPDGPPALARLAARARRFTEFVDATSAASWTAPSVTTTLTGLLPSDHGVQGRMEASPLVPAVATLAEMLAAVGYQTVALTAGGWVSREMGLGQGFERFEEHWAMSDPRKLLRRTLDGLDRARPLFLLLHTYDAHDPYGRKDPPEGHDDPAAVARVNEEVARYAERIVRDETILGEDGRRLLLGWRADPLFAQALGARVGRDRAGSAVVTYQWMGHLGSDRRRETEDTLRARYRHGLELLDANLDTVLDVLDRAELPGSTATIVVSDHGEAFGEHDALGHGRWLHDVLTRVLLLVRAPSRMSAGRVRGSCGLVDVVPTVLSMCGLPVPEASPGRSLIPLAAGREAGVPVLAEDFRRQRLADGTMYTVRLVTVRTEAAKVLITWDPRDGSVTEVRFDLAADPGELDPKPVGDLATLGADFADAVTRARAHVATFHRRGDSEGEGRFSER